MVPEEAWRVRKGLGPVEAGAWILALPIGIKNAHWFPSGHIMDAAKTHRETKMKTRAYLLVCALLLVVASYALAQNPPAGGAAKPSQLDELVLANHILANEGVLDAYGHVSIRDERDPNHYLLARAIAAGSVTAADIITYDLDSNPINDTRASFSERFIHGQIYKARPDVMAVVHFHAPEVVPFTVTGVPLRPLIHMAGFLPQVIPVFEIRKAGGLTDMLVRSNELGKALADQLADKTLILLRGHGAAVTDPTSTSLQAAPTTRWRMREHRHKPCNWVAESTRSRSWIPKKRRRLWIRTGSSGVGITGS